MSNIRIGDKLDYTGYTYFVNLMIFSKTTLDCLGGV